ncbi:hypothetical protein [Flagellimonas sp. S3867]|uniref:hypothetical protein n=1 Tax=Flagellimonas sp. S3867 TaxID=2768063 RepID=UPI0016850905|nr:hypothetical protein [Flagellimonas sp. S3867]
MQKPIIIFLFVTMSSFSFSQSIKDLDFLIGTWKIVETIYPGTDKEYQEIGTRTCKYYLNGNFIKCESETMVQKNGRKRHYSYVINYDKKENCFRATNFAHDFPLHGQFKWFLDKENERIIAITPKNVIEDRFFRATISYADKNRLVWNGWASVFEKDKDWTQIFNDVTTRVE